MMLQCKTSVATEAMGLTAAGSLTALAVALLTGLAGCGQKGPLALPKAPAQAAPASMAASGPLAQ